MFKVGIVGVGFVGTAVSTGLEAVLGDRIEVREYDKYKETESLESVVNNSDIIFVCLPTPMNDDGSCDTSIVESGVDAVVEAAKNKKAIVIKSTVPPGTTARLQKKHKAHAVLFNPEFLTERNFIQDFVEQDRIILGYESGGSANPWRIDAVGLVTSLYAEFVKRQKKPAPIAIVTSKVAEMLKYVSNCYLATKVAYFNEISDICRKSAIDYDRVRELLGKDVRIGKTHMQVPGPDGKHGFGGSCFPKDLNALIAHAREVGADPMILDSVWAKNLMIREDYEWEKLAQVNGEYEKDE